jgi:hypothetical protein
MAKLKQDMARQFVQANKIMEATARQLDGMYSVGSVFKAPVGLELDMLNNKFLKSGDGFNPTLQLEDPDQYLADVKKDIAKLKKQVEENHRELMDGPADAKTQYKGILGEAKKYKENLKAEQDLWKTTAGKCLALVNRYNIETAAAIAEENKATDEYNTKLTATCRKLAQFEDHPNSFCGETSGLAEEVAEIATSYESGRSIANIKEFENVCDEYGSQTDNTDDSTGSAVNNYKRATLSTVEKHCTETDPTLPACERLVATAKLSGTSLNAMCIPFNFTPKFDDQEVKDVAQSSDVLKEFCETREGDIIKKRSSDGECSTIKLTEKNEPVYFDMNDSINSEKYLKKVLASYLPQIKEKAEETTSTTKKCDANSEDNVSGNPTIARALRDVQSQIEMKQKRDRVSDMGGVSIAACNASMDNGVGKGIMNLGEQVGRGLASPTGANAFGY